MRNGMDGLFLSVAKISITAAVIVMIVLLVRICMRRIPKKYICVLWLVVLFRFLCPFVLEGPIPAFRMTEVIENPVFWAQNEAEDRIQEQEEAAGQVFSQQNTEAAIQETEEQAYPYPLQGGDFEEAQIQTGGTDTDLPSAGSAQEGTENTRLPEQYPMQAVSVLVRILSMIWAAGVLLFAAYGIYRYSHMKNKLKTAVLLPDAENAALFAGEKEGRRFAGITLRESGDIVSPMVFGLLKPGIYLPSGFAKQVGGEEYRFVLMHERAHIKRGDILWKLCAYAALCLHWMNPFAWISVLLFQKDMEMACDEYVLKKYDGDVRKGYAGALLQFAADRSGLVVPPAFGESNTESRIKNILHYKKPSVWISAVAVVIVLTGILVLATKPHTRESAGENSTAENMSETEQDSGSMAVYSDLETMQTAYQNDWALETGETVYYVDGTAQYELEEIGAGEEKTLTFYFCTITEDGIPSFYKTIAACRIEEDGIYVLGREQIHYDSYASAEQLLEIKDLLVRGVFGYRPDARGRSFSALIEERALLADSSIGPALTEPGSALELLLHLEGGTAAVFPCNNGTECRNVVYRFADGSSVCVQMGPDVKNGRNYWFPETIYEDTYNEDLILSYQYISEVTADELKEVSGLFSMGAYPNYEWKELDDRFAALSMVEGEDVVLYGLFGGEAMVLRDGDTVYPIFLFWTSPQMNIPEIYTGDYDQDGVKEYALRTHMGTGTGVSRDELYILEPEGDTCRIIEFTGNDIITQLNARISYEWIEEEKEVQVYVDGTYQTSLYLEEFLQLCEGDYEDMVLGDILHMTWENNGWMLTAEAGIKVEGYAILQYLPYLEFEAPISYDANGRFTLGEIQAYAEYEL